MSGALWEILKSKSNNFSPHIFLTNGIFRFNSYMGHNKDRFDLFLMQECTDYFIYLILNAKFVFWGPQTSEETHYTQLRGVIHPKIKILGSFTRPPVIPNLCDMLSSMTHKGCIWMNHWYSPLNDNDDDLIYFHYMRKSSQDIVQKNHHLCSTE